MKKNGKLRPKDGHERNTYASGKEVANHPPEKHSIPADALKKNP